MRKLKYCLMTCLEIENEKMMTVEESIVGDDFVDMSVSIESMFLLSFGLLIWR